ncbi:MAG TPA: alkaline phosphatase family protein, partial [Flavitalea sp.]|nr:alkaline phosphatase family protein [Flavitalea sp.]
MKTIILTGRGLLLTVSFMVIFVTGFSQPVNKMTGASKPVTRKTENLVMIALDGMRWQEIFGGIDSAILTNSRFTRDAKDLKERFWAEDKFERRKRLMPFFWTTIAEKGQLYGNREHGNFVSVANPYKLTYPGFSETVTGNPDTTIRSNSLIKNKNANVLEFINRQKGYQGKVATFATSVLFPYILNKERNGLIVNADDDSLPYGTPQMQLLNEMQRLSAKPIGERQDLLTYFAGREYLKTYRPKVLYLPLGETDAFAHKGLYDMFIGAVHAEDAMIADIWNLLQSIPQYRDKTTMIITCDHGRGDVYNDEWMLHGPKINNAENIWFAVIGPDTKPLGEIKTPMQIYQGQLAATVAELLGFHYTAEQRILPPI